MKPPTEQLIIALQKDLTRAGKKPGKINYWLP
jgi:hypothetical protein